jgi:hypothetical protein
MFAVGALLRWLVHVIADLWLALAQKFSVNLKLFSNPASAFRNLRRFNQSNVHLWISTQSDKQKRSQPHNAKIMSILAQGLKHDLSSSHNAWPSGSPPSGRLTYNHRSLSGRAVFLLNCH